MNPKEARDELKEQLESLMKTPSGRRHFLMAMPIMLAACGAPSRHRYREGDNTGQDIQITVEDEIRMTQEVLPDMQKDYPPHQDRRMQNYIADLGQRITQANGLEGDPYHYSFTVVDVDMINAFALPAGTVFVTAPLIAKAETEAELAGVVGHEIGHIQARHTAERIDRMQRERTRSLLKTIGGALLGGGAGFGLGQLLCPPRDRECIAKATAAGAAVGAGASLMIQRYSYMAHSREDEMEADRIGFRTSVQAGYHKDHVGDFYEKLYEMDRARKRGRAPVLSTLADAMSTHPPGRERVEQMRKLAREEVQAESKISSDQFSEIRARAERLSKKAS